MAQPGRDPAALNARGDCLFGIPYADVQIAKDFTLRFSRGGSTFVWAGGAWRNVNYMDKVYVPPRPKPAAEPVIQRLLRQIADS